MHAAAATTKNKAFHFQVRLGSRSDRVTIHAPNYGIASQRIQSHYPRAAIISPDKDWVTH